MCYNKITKRKRKGMKKMYTIKVYCDGLSYYVKKPTKLSARLFQLSHLLRRTGYKTKILELED